MTSSMTIILSRLPRSRLMHSRAFTRVYVRKLCNYSDLFVLHVVHEVFGGSRNLAGGGGGTKEPRRQRRRHLS